MKRVLIDDNQVHPDGCKMLTFIEYPGQSPDTAKIADPDVLALELQYAPIGISGYRLVEEKQLADGSKETTQEFNLAPDIAYALFKHWEDLDRASQSNPPDEPR